MKSFQIISFIFISLFLVFTLSGCNSNTTNNEKIETEDTPSDSQEDFQEDKGVITDTITFGDEGDFYGEITKNKISKKAQVESSFKISDEDEVVDFMGADVFMVPFTVNMMCNIMNIAFFDPEKLTEINEKESLQEDSEMWDLLKDYKVTSIKIKFIDVEDKETIAECSSTGKDSLKFKTYREYDPEKSFFKSEIGVFKDLN